MTTALPERTSGDVEVERGTGWRIREGIAQTIREMALPGIRAERVYHRRLAKLNQNEKMPCIVVAKTRGQFAVSGTNARDDHRYGAVILIVRASTLSADATTQNAMQLEHWFESIAKKFAGQRPAFNVPGVCFASVFESIDTDPLMAARWVQQLDAAYLSLRITAREGRP